MKQPQTIHRDEAKPAEPKAAKVESRDDHVAHIAELARGLRTTSPSGAETIGDKILHHVAAIQDPETHNKAVAEAQKIEDAAEAERAESRKALKTPAGDKARVA